MYRAIAAALLTVFAGAVLAASLPHLSYADLDGGGMACCLVPDQSGNVYVIGSAGTDFGSTDISVTRFDSSGALVSNFRFGGAAADQAHGAALDPQGNLVIVGQTQSVDFPLIGALITKTEPNAPAAFVLKINPANGQILFSTRLGGTAAEPGAFGVGTIANAVAVDPGGNIYVAGTTNAPDFPVTPDAFQKTGAGGTNFGPRPYAFVTKLSAQGDRLLYSTLLGGSVANCIGGSHCIGQSASTSATAIAVDATGSATVGGSTNAPDFPVTPGAIQSQCRCLEYAGNAFVVKLNAAGSALVWSTFLGGSPNGDPQFPESTNAINSLVLAASGAVIVSGATDGLDFPVTPGAFQVNFGKAAGPSIAGFPGRAGFVTELNPQGTGLLFSTFVGGSGDDQVTGLTVDSQGFLWLTGATTSLNFPGAPNDSPYTGSFLAELNSTGSALLRSRRLPAGAGGGAISITADGTVWALGAAGSLLQFPNAQIDGNSVFSIGNSAGGGGNGSVAPGEYVSFYGTGFGNGPAVLFDGVAAPVLYSTANQINVLAPYGLSARNTAVEVIAPGAVYSINLFVKPAQPQVFRIFGNFAAALNQNATINSSPNPAASGSIVTIFASGAGLLSTLLPDGAPTPAGLQSHPLLPVSVLGDSGRSLEVLYAGPSQGLPQNALQVNFRLPQQTAPNLTFRLMIGAFISDPFTLFLQQI